MSNVMIKVSTSKAGSEVVVNSGFSHEEWAMLNEDSRCEIINEKVWEVIYTKVDYHEPN